MLNGMSRPILMVAAFVGGLALFVAFAAGSSHVARADPDTVQAGHDLLETDTSEDSETYIDFAQSPLPADFFGPGSDPFNGRVDLEGVPFDSFGGFDGLTPTDTIVERLQNAGPSFPAMINIEIVRLELVSVEPLTVTGDGAQYPQTWDMTVQVPGGQTQDTGSMTISHDEGTDGGTFDIELPVRPKLTFTEVGGPGGPYVYDELLIEYEATNVPWCHTANPLDDPPGQVVIEKSGLTTNFFPGIVCESERTKGVVGLHALSGAEDHAHHDVLAAENAGPASVGGIAELPDVSDSAGRNYVALAGVAAAALVALGAGGWYARRRWAR